jgi:hypothetical protein
MQSSLQDHQTFVETTIGLCILPMSLSGGIPQVYMLVVKNCVGIHYQFDSTSAAILDVGWHLVGSFREQNVLSG